MRNLALACSLFLLAAQPALALTEIYSDFSPPSGESITGNVLNQFSQDVTASNGCQMTGDEKNADYILEVVSIIDDAGSSGDDSSAYSVTLTDGSGSYISSVVGICGSSEIISCGDSLYKDIERDLPNNQSC
jgi:hypothetical protein